MADLEIKIQATLETDEIERQKSSIESSFNSKPMEIPVKLNTQDLKKAFDGLGKSIKLDGSAFDKLTAQLNRLKQSAAFTDANTSGITKLRTEISKLDDERNRLVTEMGKLDPTSDQFAQYTKSLAETDVQLRSMVSSAKLLDGTFKSNVGLEKAQHQIDALRSKFALMEQNWTKIKKHPELVQEMDRLKSALQDVDATTLSNVNAQMTAFSAHARAAGADTQTFGDKVKASFMKLTAWASGPALLLSAVKIGKDIVQNVTDINTSMTELKKVTDETDASYERFLSNTSKRASDLSTPITDLIDTTSEFARLGYSMKDAAGLGEWASIYNNVGDNVGGVEQATASIVSVMKAYGSVLDIYGNDVDKAGAIVDKFNLVANKYAVSSGDIGAGLRNAASSLSISGNSLDQSIAMLTAMTEITQDASESGNALKILSMRLRGERRHAHMVGNYHSMCA